MADTKVTSLRFRNDQYNKVKDLAAFHGVSVTMYMRDAVIERMEDEEDYNDAIANLKASHGKTVSSNDIRKSLGID
jgi:predicted DNA-binding protein